MRDEKTYSLAVIPYFAILLLLTGIPVAYLFYLSCTGWNLLRPGSNTLIGVSNYVRLFSERRFLHSLLVTAQFIAIPVTLQMFFGLFVALLVNSIVRGSTVTKSLFILPLVVPPVLVGLIFRILYTPRLGGLDFLFDILGLPSIDWLSYPASAFWAVVIAAVWEWTPFVMLMFIAALESFPQEPFEAARIDGASMYQTFRYVTLPLLRPTVYVILYFRIIEALGIFPLIFVMTSGGPAGATEPTNFYSYVTAFDYLKIGYAASMMVVFFGLIVAFNLYFMRGIIRRM